jgi:hypothetical protein
MVKALRLIVHEGGDVEEALKLVVRTEKPTARSIAYPYWE